MVRLVRCDHSTREDVFFHRSCVIAVYSKQLAYIAKIYDARYF